MTIIEALIKLRDDIKLWVANNLKVKLDKNLGADNANKFLSINNKGDIIPSDLTRIEVDVEMSYASENPVQNKVITNALKNKLDNSHNTSSSAHSDIRRQIVTDYNHLNNAPSINNDKSDSALWTDENGNIIAKVDANGITTTAINIAKLFIGSKNILNDIPYYQAGRIENTQSTAVKGTSSAARTLIFDFQPECIILHKKRTFYSANDIIPILWIRDEQTPMEYLDKIDYTLGETTGTISGVQGSVTWGTNYVTWETPMTNENIPDGALCSFASNLLCDGEYYYIAFGKNINEEDKKLAAPAATLTQTNNWE